MNKVVLGLMACLMSLGLSTSVLAAKPKALVAQGPDFSVTVYPSIKCTSKKVAKILKEHEAPFEIVTMFKATVQIEGKKAKINACAEMNPGAGFLMVVGEDGKGAMLPLDMFVESTSI